MKLYRLNREEREILERARRGDVAPFTNYYLKSPTTGTRWLPGAKTERWKAGYHRLYTVWNGNKRPDKFIYADKEYVVSFDHEMSADFPDFPEFFHNHGFLFLPWQQDLHNDRTAIRTIVGGFGSGKTLSQAVSLLIHAVTLPGFRGFGLAPESKQANEIAKLAGQVMQNTLYEERFLIQYTRGPNAYMRIGHDGVGENTIECYPIGKREDTMRTLTGDMAVVDQAEKFDDLESVIRDVGTRFRGRELSSGRSRIGTLTLVANSDYNESLWRVYDMAEEMPHLYKSLSPSTYDNPYLTDADIQRYEAQVGADDESKRVYLLGGRPLGEGKEFSKAIIQGIRDKNLDLEMEDGLSRELPGYIKSEAKHVGVYEWLLPYKEGHRYLVISDPGTGNAPDRNAFAIFVWDITDFPGDRNYPKPAHLVGYIWGFGRGDISNWANKHVEMVYRYHAVGTNGFDATGFQSGYDTWMPALYDLLAEKISLAGNGKALCLNSAKLLCAKGLIKVPEAVTGLYSQMMRYELPEPPKLKQDLVITFNMSCWWLQRLFFMSQDYEPLPDVLPYEDRYDRPVEERNTGFAR